VVEEAARSADDHCHSLSKSGLLLAGVFATHDCPSYNVVEQLKKFLELELDLHTELSGRRKDYAVCSILPSDLFFIKRLMG